MLVGGFVSASGGVHKAIERAAENEFEVAMFFIGSPHSWNLPTLDEGAVEKYNQTVTAQSTVKKTYAHALYLANLASPNKEQYTKSVKALSTTMQNGEKIGLQGVIFHLGSHKDSSHKEGLDRVAQGMREVLDNAPGKTHLMMENSVEQGNKVGTRFSDLEYVLEQLDYDPRATICLDTCHSFAMGYNYADDASYRQWVDEIEKSIGIERVKCFHINDSKGELDSHIDRHANLGEGNIGLDGFKNLINDETFADKDFILEVPGVNGNGPSKADRDILLAQKQ